MQKALRKRLEGRGGRYLQFCVITVVAMVCLWLISGSHASTAAVSFEAENGTKSGQATPASDVAASGGQAVKFGTASININDQGVGIAGNMVSLSTANQDAELADMKSLGMTWIRVDLTWNSIQPAQNGAYNWTAFDNEIAAAQSYGIKVDGIIDYDASWNETAGCTNWECQPADLNAYATFAQAVVSHFGNKLGAVEIWNEPNLTQFWQPKPDAGVYTSMLKLAYSAIKVVDPSMLVLSGGLSPSSDNATTGNIAATTFLSTMYADGAQNYFDALAYHPYSYPALPAQNISWSGWSKMYQTSPNVRDIMTTNGDSAKRIWITEVGAPTNGPGVLTTCAEANADNYPTGSDHVDTCLQAEIDSQSITLARTYPWVGPVFLYTYKDSGTDPSTKENFFGLIDYSNNQKPSYAAVQSAIAGQ